MISRLSFAVFTLVACASSSTESFPRDEFDARISQYLKLRKKAIADTPKLKTNAVPAEIQAHKSALAAGIRALRADAKQGGIFTPAARTFIVGIVRSEMRGKEGASARRGAKEGNPPVEGHPVAVKVNAIYPDTAPLSTVPPTLLLRLPALPKELDYRFVGRHLILRDVEASIIIDFIPDVTP